MEQGRKMKVRQRKEPSIINNVFGHDGQGMNFETMLLGDADALGCLCPPAASFSFNSRASHGPLICV